MRPVQIIPVMLGMVNAYLVKQVGAILIDTGVPGSEQAILNAMQAAGIGKGECRLILVTHAHGDHAGSAARLQEMTGALVAVHEDDAGHDPGPGCRAGLVPDRVDRTVCRSLLGSVNRAGYPPVNPDIVLDGTMDLAPFGIDGTVIPTPGLIPGDPFP